MKKVISILIMLLFLCGCSKSNDFDKISEAIVNFHTDINYDISNLNERDIELLVGFKEKEKLENKVINLSKLDMFNDYFKTNEEDSDKVYYSNGNYFIKYTDLLFEKANGDYYARVVAGNHELELKKSSYPILYEETNNLNYQYKFVSKTLSEDEIKYYYRSYANGSMLTINYELEDNNIKDITLKYYDNFYLDEDDKSDSNVLSILFMILPLLIIIIIAIFIGRKLLRNKEV